MNAERSMDFTALLDLVRRGRAAVHTHSGQMRRGDVFVPLPAALPVCTTDEQAARQALLRYVPAAIAGGAAYVVCPFQPDGLPENVFWVAHPDPRVAVGSLAMAQYGTQENTPKIIGITGTNGKTTVAYVLEALFSALGYKAGVIGTVQYRWPGHREKSSLTTPGCLELHAILAAMRQAGTDIVLVEVSSHALDQNRVAGLNFVGALFTNLTQDHLDYHQNMDAYFAAKDKLFRTPEQGGVSSCDKVLAVNSDDAYGIRILAERPEVVSYGLLPRSGRHLLGSILEQSPQGLYLNMQFGRSCWKLRSPLVGRFNAMNLLAAQAMGLALGLTVSDLQCLSGFTGVPGRLERVRNIQNLAVFVDYAHTPDALLKALQALRDSGFSRVLTVFGCGGDRDRTKRPMMGAVAAQLSDVVILTSDNPRTEDPISIMADVLPGLTACRHLEQEPDRRAAIARALDLTRPGDALLIAGKGHESHQIIGTIKYSFSDQQVVRDILGCV